MISAKAAILKMLSRRSYFSKELQKKLHEKGYPPAEIEEALQFAGKHGFLNDEEQLQRFVSYKKARGYGPAAIRFQLRDKSSTPIEIPFDEQIQTIKIFLDKRFPDWKNVDQKGKRKLFATLQRRGFSFDAMMAIFASQETD